MTSGSRRKDASESSLRGGATLPCYAQRSLNGDGQMGDFVDLHGQPAHLEDDHELIENLARYAEGLLSKEAVKKKHRFEAATWEQLGENDALVEAIEAEKLRRIRNGQAKRELAQKHVVKAPRRLNVIMLDQIGRPSDRQ